MKHQTGPPKKQQQKCAQNQFSQHFRMAKPSVSPSPWPLEQQFLFLHCFPMAQPSGEAPDRNQQKKIATNVFFLVSIFCFVGDRDAASTTLRFQSHCFHWPWHQIEQQNGNPNVLSKTRDPKKKRGKFFKYGNLLKNHQYF